MHGIRQETSPLASLSGSGLHPSLLSEGPVRFLLVSGHRDDSRWGLLGAYWLTIDGTSGGFLVAPGATWRGSEHVRCFRSALRRGWDEQQIYSFWQTQVGASGDVMIDPQQHADVVFQVARRVGAL